MCPGQELLRGAMEGVDFRAAQGIGVQNQGAELRGKAVQLILPVSDQGGRGHHQGGSVVQLAGFVQVHQPADDLQGFAQAHVIGQAGPEAAFCDVQQKAHALLLVVSQDAVQSVG